MGMGIGGANAKKLGNSSLLKKLAGQSQHKSGSSLSLTPNRSGELGQGLDGGAGDDEGVGARHDGAAGDEDGDGGASDGAAEKSVHSSESDPDNESDQELETRFL